MPYRLTKIYTRTGDEGYTSLNNQRLSKDDALLEVVGTLDELNSAIGVIFSHTINNEFINTILTRIQRTLFDFGGEIHVPEHSVITSDLTTQLEKWLDELNENLPPLQEFLLPRGNQPSAACHLARTICRRAERCLVRLHRQHPLSNPEMLRYLNRLSDLLFVIARTLATDKKNEEEMLWKT